MVQISAIKIKVGVGKAGRLIVDRQVSVCRQVASIRASRLKIVAADSHWNTGAAIRAPWLVDIFARTPESAGNQLVVDSSRLGVMRISVNIGRLPVIMVATFADRSLIMFDALLAHSANGNRVL